MFSSGLTQGVCVEMLNLVQNTIIMENEDDKFHLLYFLFESSESITKVALNFIVEVKAKLHSPLFASD